MGLFLTDGRISNAGGHCALSVNPRWDFPGAMQEGETSKMSCVAAMQHFRLEVNGGTTNHSGR
jgi:hypothetical protein